MVAMELQALANLSITAFDPPRTADHAKHMARLKELQQLMNEHLWDDSLGIYSNKLSFNDTFYPRISPTSFYPLQSGAASDAQAAAMATKWLMNETRFCVAPEGDMAGNADTW
jgi:neutral trehalase